MGSSLLDILRDCGIDRDPREIAEAIWLAQFMDSPSAEVPDKASPPADVMPMPKPAPTPAPRLARPDLPPAVGQRRANLYALADESLRSGAIPIRTPGGVALPRALELGRALRPLMRRVPSRTQMALDSEATVSRIAELRIWDAVVRPVQVRWLSVTVVVDTGPSMRMWRDTVREFIHLLTRQGAFREIRECNLDAVSDSSPVLSRRGSGVRMHPGELNDPGGRKVILVVTDCLAPAWYGNALPAMLDTWGRTHPVAIVQLLPQRLWARTGLARATEVRLSSSQPGAPNRRLTDAVAETRLERTGVKASLPFPVTTLERDHISHWARLLAGNVTGSPLGAAFVPDPIGFWAKQGELTVPQLLQRFESIASPEARQLVHLFAAAPLSLPVMRLIQRTIMPESHQAHLAEVLMSGLLYPVGEPRDADPDHVRYDFVGAVRGTLLDEARASDAVQVLKTVLSHRIEANLGTTVDFLAMLRDPDAVQTISVPKSDQVFASLAADVLRRLGGSYARLARKITDGSGEWVTRPPEDVSHLSVENFGDYLQLLWKWPAASDRVYVVWRRLEFPSSPDDPQAFKTLITRGEYELTGARIRNVPQGVWYFSVFAAYRQRGVEIVAPGREFGCREKFQVMRLVTIAYAVRHSGWRRRWEIALTSNADAEMPEAVLILGPGPVQPLNRAAGRLVASIPRLNLKRNQEHLHPLAGPVEGRGVLRLFLTEPKSRTGVFLSDPPLEERVV